MDATTLLSLGGQNLQTVTIGFQHSAASVLSWRADRDYMILGAAPISANCLINLSGDTYANLTTAGVHSNWVCQTGVQASFVPTNQKLPTGQLLYSSTSAAASCNVVLGILT